MERTIRVTGKGKLSVRPEVPQIEKTEKYVSVV